MELPESIKEITGDEPYHIDTVGVSDSEVVLFENMVLKIEDIGEESENEARMMLWLEDRLPVPSLIHLEHHEEKSYLLMTKVEGEMLCSDEFLFAPSKLIRHLADGLEMLWRIDTEECPLINDLDSKLRQAEERVNQGLCSFEDAEFSTFGVHGFKSPEALLSWLYMNRPEEELIFSHGDYCLPNIFIKEGEIAGFIDLGRSGIADKYQDIALCIRSLVRNYVGEYSQPGLPKYDLLQLFVRLKIAPDWEKIRYYSLLDELF